MLLACTTALLAAYVPLPCSREPSFRLPNTMAGPAVAAPSTTPSGRAVPSKPMRVVPKRISPPRIAPEPEHVKEYWYDPRIHNFGNIGLAGRFHALMAPFATALIDHRAYDGVDIRKRVHSGFPDKASVLDLCCGTGFSTARGAIGVDTSNEMLDMARFRRHDAKFIKGNAESFGEENSYDVVTVMFATHEMPQSGRLRVLRNAMRLARKIVQVVDISPDYHEVLATKPLQGTSFLMGEPYVLDYLKSIDVDIHASIFAAKKRWRLERKELIPKHVTSWRLEHEEGSNWPTSGLYNDANMPSRSSGFWGI